MGDAEVQIAFDEDNKVRVLEASKCKVTEELEKKCTNFTQKIDSFGETVKTLVEVLDSQAEKIEFEKLRAIGQRNLVEMEADARRRQQKQMEGVMAAKRAELERLTFFYASLEKVEREQKIQIEKLSNNEA
uniref:Intraflagellar transport protein 20 homolog n=1 Tax=Oxyrrhis marina TaxID=2969 RepID=A0A6U9KMZ0_OXYMA|mmetsp:Transcript_19357/g.46599  ORF Transcript_19357/g.46599 Transcript_19357/m.46599 type:complete len:131 (+) Transcript_19357:40-432(+)